AETWAQQHSYLLLAAREGGRRADPPGILGLFIEAKLDRLAERQLSAPVRQLLRRGTHLLADRCQPCVELGADLLRPMGLVDLFVRRCCARQHERGPWPAALGCEP